MSSIVITLQSSLLQTGTVDLELPAEVPLDSLLPPLVRALAMPSTDPSGQPITYQLVHPGRRRRLQDSQTLKSAGIATGDILSLVSVGAHRGGGGQRQTRQASASALLRCESGTVIALDNYGSCELSIGRYDARTRASPDIDLSEEPGGGTVSRSHALLRKQAGQWALIPRSTKNPTRVGNTRIPPKQSRRLKPGDIIRLGSVKLVFESSQQP